MFWSTSELRVRLARRETDLSPPVIYLTDRSKAVLLLWIIYVISVLFLLCFRARLFIDALWSPAGKGLTSWLSFVMPNCEVVTFSLVSWVRCAAWLYRYLIFALFLTLVTSTPNCINESIETEHNYLNFNTSLNKRQVNMVTDIQVISKMTLVLQNIWLLGPKAL